MDEARAIDLSIQLIFGISGMFVLAIFIIFFFLVYQRRLLKEQERANKIESDYQKSLITAGILAQESERKRMANDLHDSVGGLLSATKIYLNKLTPDLPDEEFKRLKSVIVGAVNDNIHDVRSITNDLLPQSLERVGLVAAIENLCRKLERLTDAAVRFDYDQIPRFDKHKEKAVFRILQELTNNTLKHAAATSITIQLRFSNDLLRVSYNDNGKGFDRQHQKPGNVHGNLGLKSIESRVAFLQGKMQFEASPGQGVRVTIDLETT
jgi:signal transduction histidine kinase